MMSYRVALPNAYAQRTDGPYPLPRPRRSRRRRHASQHRACRQQALPPAPPPPHGSHVTCDPSRVWCWLSRRQHNMQHVQITRGKGKLVKSRKTALGAFRKQSLWKRFEE